MARILILDDELPLLQSLSRDLGRAGHECLLAETGRAALQLLEGSAPDLAILDVQLPDMSGIEVLRHMRKELPEVPVVIITAYAAVDTAVEALREGATDYLEKPLDLEELQLVIERELDNARNQREVLAAREAARGHLESFPLLGEDAAMVALRGRIESLAQTDVALDGPLPSVLITGPAGTGKSLVARHLHASGGTSAHPFLTVDCSCADVVSRLFGCARGISPASVPGGPGLLELARHGTVHLDEVAELDSASQELLVQVIATSCVRREGTSREHPVTVRLVASSCEDLEGAVAGGHFLSDLLERLSQHTLSLPALNRRAADVPLLLEHYLKRFSRRYRLPEPVLNAAVHEQLSAWSWPGNVRELEETARALVLSGHQQISRLTLPLVE